MTICPIAIVAGCQKCPAFKICPLKGLLGDKPPASPPGIPEAKPTAAKRLAKGPAKRRGAASRKAG